MRPLALPLALLLLAGCAAPALNGPVGHGPTEFGAAGSLAHELVIKLRGGDVPADLELRVVRTIPALSVAVVALPSGAEGTALRSRLRSDSRIQYQDEVREMAVEEVEETPERSVQAADPQRKNQYGLDMLGVPGAWRTTQGAGEVVAVVDGAISRSHPDLKGRFVPGYNVARQNGEINSGNAYFFHGTFTAGLIGASADNGEGMAGIAPQSRLMPVQVRNALGRGTEDMLAAGIVWAADHGARVMAVYGGKTLHHGHGASPVLVDAVKYAIAKDVVVVTSAGNDREAISPAKHPLAVQPGVIAVAAVDASRLHYEKSNVGEAVSVVAPAVKITSTFPGVLGIARYMRLSCTSWGAAQVAGVAALVRSAHPEWSQAQVKARIEQTAVDLGADGHDPVFGHGLVNAEAAVR